jgi:hypothetical protein
MTSKANTLQVEYFRCWDDRTWDTDVLQLRGDLDPSDYVAIQRAIKEAARKIDWRDEMPVLVGLYHIADEEEEDFGEALGEVVP